MNCSIMVFVGLCSRIITQVVYRGLCELFFAGASLNNMRNNGWSSVLVVVMAPEIQVDAMSVFEQQLLPDAVN